MYETQKYTLLIVHEKDTLAEDWVTYTVINARRIHFVKKKL